VDPLPVEGCGIVVGVGGFMESGEDGGLVPAFAIEVGHGGEFGLCGVGVGWRWEAELFEEEGDIMEDALIAEVSDGIEGYDAGE